MENDIFDSLEDLGYEGELLEESALEEALQQGPKSLPYTKLVEQLVSELCQLCNVDERVSAVTDPSDPSSFLMELSGFLREYGCPYKALCEGPISQRLSSKENCLHLLDYLSTEVMAVRMLSINKPSVLCSPSATVSEQAENEVATHMKKMLIALGFPKTPANITPFELFSKVERKVKELVSSHGNQVSKPLLKARLSEKQWAHVETMNEGLEQEYDLRRDMLLKRLDVTIQSFKWSNRAKAKEDQVAAVYQPIRTVLTTKRKVSMHDVLAAREDLTAVQKITTGDVREHTQCAVNKVLMGKVPDRGGRCHELQPPPPEMPSFKKRQAGQAPQQQRPHSSRGGGRGGGRGGRVQGGWSGGNDRPQSAGGGWHQGGGGNHGYQGGGNQGGGYQGDGYQQGGGYRGGRGGRGGRGRRN